MLDRRTMMVVIRSECHPLAMQSVHEKRSHRCMHEVLRLYSLIHDCAELGAVQVLVISQSKACWNNRARMYYGRIWLYGCPEMRVTHVYVF